MVVIMMVSKKQSVYLKRSDTREQYVSKFNLQRLTEIRDCKHVSCY